MHSTFPMSTRFWFISRCKEGCIFCNYEDETLDHLLFKCSLAIMIWFTSWWQLRIDSFNWSAFEWFEVLLDCNNDFPSSSEHKNELLTYAMVVLETMWMMRNRAIHGRVIPDWKELSDHIGRKADGYWEAGR